MIDQSTGVHRMDTPATPSRALIAQQLATASPEGTKLSDRRAMDLIWAELSGKEWTPDTVDVIAAYVRGTGRNIVDVIEVAEVWSLTVHAAQCAIVTTVHPTEEAARRCLFANYDQFENYGDDLQALIDGECLVVHIEAHKVALP